METCLLFALLLFVLLLIAFTSFHVLCFNDKSNKYYCRFYKKRSWKLWEDFIHVVSTTKNLTKQPIDDKCEIVYLTDDNNNPRYEILLYKDRREAAIFSTYDDIVLSTFDHYHSKKMFDILNRRFHII